MSHNHTQPEEIELALRELEKSGVTVDAYVLKEKSLSEGIPDAWSAGCVSPYRAAHMKVMSSSPNRYL